MDGWAGSIQYVSGRDAAFDGRTQCGEGGKRSFLFALFGWRRGWRGALAIGEKRGGFIFLLDCRDDAIKVNPPP